MHCQPRKSGYDESVHIFFPWGAAVYAFLIPLLLGFALDWASAFTSIYSRRWGPRRGQQVSTVLRNLLGIPIWAVGLGMAVLAGSPALFTPNLLSQALAWLLLAAGAALILLSLVRLGRRAAAPALEDGLEQSGLYAHLRHPLYAGVILEFAGTALLRPSQAVALACVLGLGWVVIQARLEELDLLQRIPAYREYMRRVPRFFPRLGRRG